MTSAADSATNAARESQARQTSFGETEHEAALRDGAECLSGRSTHQPVFEAFNTLGLTGRDIAVCVGVTPPTVSKWRAGKARVPGDRLAFLTLVLAHLVDEAQADDDCAGEDAVWRGRLNSARAYLAYQDVLNQGLAVADIREGAQQFRAWWSSGDAQALQDKVFNIRPNASRLDVEGATMRVKA